MQYAPRERSIAEGVTRTSERPGLTRREQKTHGCLGSGRRCGCRRGDVVVNLRVSGARRAPSRRRRGAAPALGRGGSREGRQEVRCRFGIEALGTVTPMASVAIKSRVDSEIAGVHFADGAKVKQGDLLFTLDSRAIEAQIRRPRASSPRAKAQLEQAPSATSSATPNWSRRTRPRRSPVSTTPRPRSTCLRAALQVQQGARSRISRSSSATPRSARRSPAASAWPSSRSAISCGRPICCRSPPSTDRADLCLLRVPQRHLPDVREALADETATVEAVVPGEPTRATARSR